MLLHICVCVEGYVHFFQAKLKKELGVVLVFQPSKKISSSNTSTLLLFYDWRTRYQIKTHFHADINTHKNMS